MADNSKAYSDDEESLEGDDRADSKAEEKSEKKKSKEDNEQILDTAQKRFKLAAEAEVKIREAALEDIKFRAGEQWPEELKKERKLDKRPCLVINKIPQSIRQITNDQRQNRPAIKVSPVDDKSDPETAKIYQGIIRHIEYNSNADVAYDTAFEGAVTGGFGHLRVLTDYCDPESFDQDIFIKRIRNQFSVYLDPTAQEPDGSDVNWGFIVEDLLKEDFEAQFPNADPINEESKRTIGDNVPLWFPGDKVRVAEYFYKDFKEVEIVKLDTGEVVRKSDLHPEAQVTIIQTRKTKVPVIKWCKICGTQVLDSKEWPGKWIPIVPVYGDELYIDGERILESLIRHAKDSQRQYNYWKSVATETIALAPRAPFIGVEGQFKGHEKKWELANRKNFAYLEYSQVDLHGRPAPMPQRQVYEPPVQAITQAGMEASEDIKATTGIYDASLGARSNETSGRAINARNRQAQTSNFHFNDNFTRSLRHLGRIIVDLIPKIYDTARAIRIIGEDGQQEIVRINQEFQKPNGEVAKYDMSVGKFDVIIDAGPSYATKREEARESMLEFIRVYPPAAQVTGDLLAKNMDWPQAQDISDRLKKILPPGIADDKESGNQVIPPEVKAKLDQQGQMIEQLSRHLHAAQDEIDQKKIEQQHEAELKRIEIESRERIELRKLQVQLEIAMANMGSKESIELLRAQIAEIENRVTQNLDWNEGIEMQEMDSDSAMPQAMPDQMPTGGQPPGQPMEQ